MAEHWRAPVAISVFPSLVCDTVELATPRRECSSAAPPAAPLAAAGALQSLAAVEATLARQYALYPSASVAHELGLVQLTVRADSSGLDRSVTLLREAATLEPSRDDYSVDFAGALLLRYATHRALTDLLEATDVVSRFALQPTPAAQACWNFMVALSWLTAREQLQRVRSHCEQTCATDDCPLPVVMDGSPSPDADPRTVALDGRYTDAAWDYATTALLPRWAASMRAADTALTRELRTELMQIHEALLARGADSSIGVALGEIERHQPGSARRTALLRALELYAEGRRTTDTTGPRTANALLDSIFSLTNGDDQLRMWAGLYRANRTLTAGRPNEALQQYRALGAGRVRTTTVLGGRLAFNEGISLMALGDQIGGLRRVETQAEACAAVKRSECAAAAYAMAAGIASVVGDIERSDHNTQRALEYSSGPLRPSRWSLLSVLRQTAELYGFWGTEDILHREALVVADQLNRPDLGAQELVQHSSTRLRTGDTVALPALIDRLGRVIEERLLPNDQRFFLADVAWLEGEYRLLTGRRGARTLLESAIRQMAGDTNSVRQLRPRLSLARAIASEGDTARALSALDSLLRSLESRSGADASMFERARLADDASAAGMAAAELLRGRDDNAALLRALSVQPFMGARLPHSDGDSSRVDVAVRRFGDSVLVWSRAGSDWTLRASYLPAASVREASAKLEGESLSLLFDALVRPAVSGAPESVRTIRVDARGDLSTIAWAALYDRREQRYLVERFAVSHTDDLWRAPDVASGLGASRVLVIDAAPRTGARALPGAQYEVELLQEIWGESGERYDATVGATSTLRKMSPYHVVHFAGHAVLDARRPERSYLALPSAADARISALHLSTQSLPRTRLVVLAACDTRGEHIVRTQTTRGGEAVGSGLQSLANAFRSAGAQHVIGAAWAIDDAATTAFMARLHASLRAGVPPAFALREAQLESVRSQDPARRTPRVWAAFQLLGS